MFHLTLPNIKALASRIDAEATLHCSGIWCHWPVYTEVHARLIHSTRSFRLRGLPPARRSFYAMKALQNVHCHRRGLRIFAV